MTTSKMDATELRIGNLVKDEYDKRVKPIETGMLSNWDVLERDYGGYKPIPLTEEWLGRLGFIRQGSRNMWVKDKLCIDLKELPNIRGEFIEGWYIGLKDLGNVLFHSFMKIKHVHQLQNLYFALKNEELTLTNHKKMDNSFYERLLTEAQELATKTNALNDFMRTQKFVDLDRQNKDLLYKQSRLMNEYLQVLGQRIELLGEKFSFKS